MRRIVIAQNGDIWSFDRQGLGLMSGPSPLRAAIAAMDYGESLRGTTALGYIIRLNHPAATSPEEMITLHTQVF
jgi:hypothetical protein